MTLCDNCSEPPDYDAEIIADELLCGCCVDKIRADIAAETARALAGMEIEP